MSKSVGGCKARGCVCAYLSAFTGAEEPGEAVAAYLRAVAAYIDGSRDPDVLKTLDGYGRACAEGALGTMERPCGRREGEDEDGAGGR